ncbi:MULTISPECIES: hypothetical protein [Gimesia]|uniref:Uncharacterized protein n=1 Tax=Gimesia benthica TaxID=2608982 RepID=A0A6I6AF86_9PLAN|nr:hypothetical protein [Gimesia benthica]QGQ25047.1 hypothetical protein F1728_21185 [Gimesia benthica]
MKKKLSITLIVCALLVVSLIVYASVQNARQKRLDAERVAAEARQEEIDKRREEEAEKKRIQEKIDEIEISLERELKRRKAERETAALKRRVDFTISDDSQDPLKVAEFKSNEAFLKVKAAEADLELVNKAADMKEKILAGQSEK